MVIDSSDKERLIRVGRCEETIDDKGEEFGIGAGRIKTHQSFEYFASTKTVHWTEWSYDDRTTTGFLSRQLGESIDIHLTKDI